MAPWFIEIPEDRKRFFRNEFVTVRIARISDDSERKHLLHWEVITKISLDKLLWECPKCGKKFKTDDLEGACVVFPDDKESPRYVTPICKECHWLGDRRPFKVYENYLVMETMTAEDFQNMKERWKKEAEEKESKKQTRGRSKTTRKSV